MRTGWVIVSILFLFLMLPAPSQAAAGEGSGWGWVETVGRWVNLLLLFGGVYYLARKPASRFFEQRRDDIRRNIEEARKTRVQAEDELALIRGRVVNLDRDLAALRADAEKEAEQERKRILDQTDQEAQKILAQARREIDGRSRIARNELKSYAAQLAVQLAEGKITKELDSGHERSLADRFVADLEARSSKGPTC